ncbi:MAG: IS1 family transposase [bacterium]|nr:IS1 family transposase [bacterium]
MNRLATEKRALILQCITEGMSIRATSRLVGCSKNTTTKLLVEAGRACAEYQDRTLRNLPCKRVQADETWSFVYAKARNAPYAKNPEAGDVWTWIAICEDSKLVPAWWIGDRTYATGILFMEDLAERMAGPIQLTTDGLKAYPEVVDDAFADWMVEHRILKQKYPTEQTARTAYVERQNLTLRMNNRRYARATNAFSKKLENHAHSMALYFMVYNFVRPHRTLGRGITPAMAIGLEDKPWTHADIVRRLLDSN